MKRMSFSALIGLLLVGVGFVVMTGWYVRIPIVITLQSDLTGMMFNTALCFLVAGVALLVPAFRSYLGALIFTIAALSVSQDLFHYSLGLDQLFVKVWLLDENPHPGRMANNTAVAFMLTGLVFMLFAYTRVRAVAIGVQVAIFSIMAIGVSVSVGYALQLELLYSWYQYTRMALHTAFGFTLLGVGMAVEWGRSEANLRQFVGREDKKILVISAIILASIAMIAGVAGFSTSTQRDNVIMQKFLRQSLQNQVESFSAALLRPVNEMASANRSQMVTRALLAKTPQDKEKYFAALTKLLFSASFTAIQLKDAQGVVILAEGKLTRRPQAVMPVKLPYHAQLLWRDDFSLQMSSEVVVNGRLIGTLVAEWPLDGIDQLMVNDGLYVCAQNKQAKLICLPSGRATPTLSIFSNSDAQRQLERLARSGTTGFVTGNDYRGQVAMVNYEPRSSLGLGFVLKANMADLVQPMRQQLEVVLPLLLITVIFGVLLLYWQVLPLVRKVVRSEEKLQESEARFRLSFDSAAIGMALISLEGYWLKVNPMLCRTLGYSEDELLSMQTTAIVHPDDANICTIPLQELVDGKMSSFQVEKRFYRKDNQLIWMAISVSLVRDQAGKPLYFIAQLQDVSAKKRAEQELSYQAYYDALTGLVNRNQLEQSLDKAVSTALRQQKNFAVFFMDIDHFKKINDTMGHDVGDELLKIVANRLKNCTRITDVAARLGGDEFILILNGVNSPGAAASFADKVLDTVIKPIKINEHELHISISIGISFYPNDGVDYHAILKSADMALYSAKQKGRNNYQFCTPEMNAEIAERIALKTSLQEALDHKEFHLDYQQKLALDNKRIVGVEAFLRWTNPQYGDVSPNKLIPLAEESGVIVPISEWVMLSACQQMVKWQKSGLSDLSVTVNISNKQFKRTLFVESVLNALKESNLAPYHLEVEIAEALIMQDPEYSLKIIRTLKDIGVQVTIDNFGTGYSSLVYLHRFAVDKVKIDRVLIQQLAMSSWHGALIVAMISLAKSLGMRVAAEGVETKEQYDFLLQQGCDELQGYYIGYPVSEEKMSAYLTAERLSPTV